MKIRLILILVLTLVLFSCKTIEKTVIEDDLTEIEENISEISYEEQQEFEVLYIEALKEKMLGNQQTAVALLTNCLEINPNSAAAMFELANIYYSNNDLTSASLLLEKAITINPDNKWYKIFLAQIYQQSQKYDQSAKVYQQLSEEYPEDLDFIYYKALMLSNAEKFEEAILAYDQLESRIGINEQISVSKQQLYVLTGEIDKAFNEINRLIEFNPEETRYVGLLADLYYDQGDKEDALKNYNRILEMDPENGFVHFSLSNYYMEEGDVELAFEHTKLGFKSDQVDIDTKIQVYLMLTSDMGSSRNRISNKQIEDLINILIDQHPDDFRVYTISAEYYMMINELEIARDQLYKVIELEQSDYLIWERVLFINNDLQEWGKLYEDSKKTIEYFPNQPNGYFFNGIACLQLEKYEEAEKISEEGLDYVIDNPQLEGQIILLKGEALYNLDKYEEAFSLFDEVLLKDPNNFIAMNNYAYYLSIKNMDLDKAERMSGKVIEQFPQNPTYLDTYAWVLFKKKEYLLAKTFLETALMNGGEENPTLLEHYGDILIMLQESEKAKEYWLKAKEYGGATQLLEKKINDLKYYEN